MSLFLHRSAQSGSRPCVSRLATRATHVGRRLAALAATPEQGGRGGVWWCLVGLLIVVSSFVLAPRALRAPSSAARQRAYTWRRVRHAPRVTRGARPLLLSVFSLRSSLRTAVQRAPPPSRAPGPLARRETRRTARRARAGPVTVALRPLVPWVSRFLLLPVTLGLALSYICMCAMRPPRLARELNFARSAQKKQKIK